MRDERTAARELEAIVSRCAAGEISPAVALMEMLIEAEDDDAVGAALAGLRASPRAGAADAIDRLRAEHAPGCARVAAMLRSDTDSPPKGASVEEGVAFCRRLFDWSVRQSEEASVALYSLGSADVLRRATDEIVDLLGSFGSLGSSRRALDIGCGIGRLEVALSPRLASIDGVDVSAEMIAAARRRCGGLTNVRVATCSGLDLHPYPAGAFDLVLAVDSFPYLVQSGMPLARTILSEARRVLAPHGDLVILNFSYRGDLDADRRDLAVMGGELGLVVVVNGSSPFTLWNGAAFRLRAA